MTVDKKKVQAKLRERMRSQLLVNITMRCLDGMLAGDPQFSAWRGWRYAGWTDEELEFFRDCLFMLGGWKRYKSEAWKEKNKKAYYPGTTLPPASFS